MKIEYDVPLKPYNSFGIESSARHLIRVYSEREVFEVMAENLHPVRIIGGGSNILLTEDMDGYVLKNEIKGIEIVDEDDERVLVRAGAGEIWNTLVTWSVSHGLGGIENLILIPGTVGAAPIQNIGAYGIEQKNVFHSLSAIDLESGERVTFYKHQCQFGYRESIFKNEAKNRFFITHVHYLLYKKNHVLTLDYGDIQKLLQERNITKPTISDVASAIAFIRTSKLPDPAVTGNAGSFFKNPVIDAEKFGKLKDDYPDLPSFQTDDIRFIKLPAAWLIEKSGFKGVRLHNIGVHEKQALVLVNYGGGSGHEIWMLAKKIQSEVNKRFGIELQPEVNVW